LAQALLYTDKLQTRENVMLKYTISLLIIVMALASTQVWAASNSGLSLCSVKSTVIAADEEKKPEEGKKEGSGEEEPDCE
jgi:hypothetical protein